LLLKPLISAETCTERPKSIGTRAEYRPANKPFQSHSQVRIPTFGPDGSPRRKMLLDDLIELEKRNLVFLRRGRRGVVTSAHFYGQSRSIKAPLCAPLFTRYTEREHVGNCHSVIAHKRLPYAAADAQTHHIESPQVLNLIVRSWFIQVLLSCSQG
jgi:hypothetical protein